MKTTPSAWFLRVSALTVAICGLYADSLQAQPQIGFPNQAPTVAEGATGSVEVTLSSASSSVVTVNFQTSAGPPPPATGGAACGGAVDFVNTTGTLQFDPGVVSRTIPVTTCTDAADEGDEKIRITLNTPSGATIGTQQARLTIIDAGPPPLPSISVDDASFPEGNAGTTTQNATVRLSAASTQAVTVAVAALPGTATGGAGACVGGSFDFQFLPRPVTIPAGQTSLAVPFSVCGDTTVEPDESFSVQLSSPVNATLGDPLGQVTITNDDLAPLTVSIRDTAVNEGNLLARRVVDVSVTLSRPNPTSVSVAHTVVGGGSATTGSACEGAVDFLSQAGTVVIPAGQVVAGIPVTVCGDITSESDETVLLRLSNPSAGTLADPNAVFTIRNDEIQGTGTQRADLVMDVLSSPDLTTQFAPNLVFVPSVNNAGDFLAQNVVVRSTLPRGVAFRGVEANTLGTCQQDSTDPSGALQVNCTLSTLAPGARGSVRILGQTQPAIADNTRVTFSSTVDPSNGVLEHNENNNTDSIDVTVRRPADIQIQLTSVRTRVVGPGADPIVSGGNCRTEGNTIFVDLTIRNNGPDPTPIITTTTDWSDDFAATGPGICFESCGGTVRLLSGQSTPLGTIQAVVRRAVTAPRQQTFTVDPDRTIPDPNTSNNAVTVQVCQ